MSDQILEQLARAHAHLQNVYLADKEPGNVTFDVNKIGEWLMYLQAALPEGVHEMILKRSEELDVKQYGTKNQKAEVSDVRPGRPF